MKISNALKLEIITRGKVDIEYHHSEIDIYGHTTIIPSYKEIGFFLNLNNNPTLLKECIIWSKYLDDLSYPIMKIDIGSFKGLFPVEIDSNGLVVFTADEYNFNNQSWKDWFVMEE